MSIPTREIRKLSIGGKMPTTRSQAQREKQRRDVGSGQLDIIPSVESETAPSTTQSPSSSSIRGRSGLVYDIRKLSPMSTTRASVGLPSEFIADERSRTFRAGGETYHAIQLNNRVAIRIYDPTTRSHRVECTCDDFKRTKSNCVHIYWLFDGLNVSLAGLSPSAKHSIAKDTVLNRISEFYNPIGQRLVNNSFHELLNTRLDDGSDVTRTIQDMLSVFDPNILPEKYGEDFASNIPTTFTSYEDLIVLNSLPITIFGLAHHNEVFRRELRNALTRDFCAVQFFEKVATKARETFERFDRYVQFGPRSDPRSVEGCAHALRQIVKTAAEYKDDRAPLMVSTKSKAAGILVDVLIQVCERNRDIYSEMTWRKTAVDPEDAGDRNLYVNLIGDPPRYEKQTTEEEEDEGEDLFFLDSFGTFAPEEWKHLLERLEHALDMIKRNGAPPAFVEKLEDLIEAYRESSLDDDPSRITGKRPALSGERESQKRRVG